jgi:hypothetical protein
MSEIERRHSLPSKSEVFLSNAFERNNKIVPGLSAYVVSKYKPLLLKFKTLAR